MESKDILNDLDADRATLAQRVRTPWWLAAGFGLIAACFVLSPATGGNQSGVIIASVVLSVAMLAGYRKMSGLKLGGLGPLSWLIVLGALLLVLGLFSTALALASLGLYGWIAIPTALAFAVGVAATLLFTALARKRMRRVR